MKSQSNLISLLSIISLSTTFVGCGASPAANSANSNTIKSVNTNTTNASNAANATNTNAASSSKSFTKTVELHGVKFVVESANSATGNTVKITPSGLEANDVQTKTVNGEVYGAEVGDLNVDQSPEVYIYTRESGGNKKATLIAFAANKKKSLSEISLAADDPKSKDMVGYNGDDEYAVVENSFARRFPIYTGTGADAKKSGKMRQIQYKLKAGEASWQLVVDKVTEF